MEQLNKVELRGVVGNVHIYDQQKGTAPFARFSLVTKHVYFQQSSGEDVVESTWHNIMVTQGKAFEDLTQIQKGDSFHVLGRIRNSRFVGQDGQERYTTDIVASLLEKESEPATVQM